MRCGNIMKKRERQKNGTQEKYIRGTITKRKGAHWKDCAPFPTDPERSRRQDDCSDPNEEWRDGGLTKRWVGGGKEERNEELAEEREEEGKDGRKDDGKGKLLRFPMHASMLRRSSGQRAGQNKSS